MASSIATQVYPDAMESRSFAKNHVPALGFLIDLIGHVKTMEMGEHLFVMVIENAVEKLKLPEGSHTWFG